MAISPRSATMRRIIHSLASPRYSRQRRAIDNEVIDAWSCVGDLVARIATALQEAFDEGNYSRGTS
jgi:hypothetical protein